MQPEGRREGDQGVQTDDELFGVSQESRTRQDRNDMSGRPVFPDRQREEGRAGDERRNPETGGGRGKGEHRQRDHDRPDVDRREKGTGRCGRGDHPLRKSGRIEGMSEDRLHRQSGRTARCPGKMQEDRQQLQ